MWLRFMSLDATRKNDSLIILLHLIIAETFKGLFNQNMEWSQSISMITNHYYKTTLNMIQWTLYYVIVMFIHFILSNRCQTDAVIVIQHSVVTASAKENDRALWFHEYKSSITVQYHFWQCYKLNNADLKSIRERCEKFKDTGFGLPDFLYDYFLDRWTGRDWQTQWPPHPPHITLVDFFFWDYVRAEYLQHQFNILILSKVGSWVLCLML